MSIGANLSHYYIIQWCIAVSYIISIYIIMHVHGQSLWNLKVLVYSSSHSQSRKSNCISQQEVGVTTKPRIGS